MGGGGGKKGATIDYGGANIRFFMNCWVFLGGGKHVRGADIASA